MNPDEIRLLSVRHPWAQAIFEPDGKNVENRGPGFPKGYRGPLLIHAGLAWSKRGAADFRIRGLGFLRTPATSGLVFGAIIGVVDVDDIHLEHGGCCSPWGESQYTRADGELTAQVTHLRFENPRRIAAPIIVGGGLGLRRVPPGVLAQVEAAVGPLTTQGES